MKMNFLRRLALLCAVLTCGMLLALPAAAAEADAPYAEDGDMAIWETEKVISE